MSIDAHAGTSTFPTGHNFSMREFLTAPEVATDLGTELLQLCMRVTNDGQLDLEEIKSLRKWLRINSDNTDIAAVPYLHGIMSRIAADGIIEPDEILELQLAIERVIPTERRTAAILARKKRETERRERVKQLKRVEKEREKDEKRNRDAERAQANRLRHCFAKIAGVTFPNDDGSERQEIISRCISGEQLILKHDAYSQYSIFATKVLRTNEEQLGHAPEYMAERILEEADDGYDVIGLLTEVTGGTFDKPTHGVNFAIFFVAKDVSDAELTTYMNDVFANRITYG